jgi:2-polyprenyl-3-methyl-5-hydroxy-6-metoxy-1,4-benzoquinol methylase
MKENAITFSFGENWKDYLKTVSEKEIEFARRDIEEWLGEKSVSGQTIVDIGSGSGIHSLIFYSLGAKTINSFDYDKNSVEATKTLWEKVGKPKNWMISYGSILDEEFVQNIGKLDLVYAWGVLHHSGALWKALENSFKLVKPGGRLWISLYAKGPRFSKDLALKKMYNSASRFGKRWMISRKIGRIILRRLRHFKNPFTWNETGIRGMKPYNDIIDWLGGLPYEVASEDEVLRFGRKYGFILERIKVIREGGCNIYVFWLPNKPENT